MMEPQAVGDKVTDPTCPGLTLRRLRSGIVFEWRGRVGGQKITLQLGRPPRLTVERARVLAERARMIVRAGGDPRGRRPSGPTTVREGVERYEREHLAFKRAGDKVGRLLRRYLAGVEGWPLETVGRAELKAAIEPHIRRGEWAAAHKARAVLWAFMRWAEAEELIERAPGRMRLPVPAARRDRVLSLGECRRLFEGALALRARHRAFVRVLLLGGFRREEAAGMGAEEVSEERIALPPERTKQGHAHEIPITAALAAELPALVRGRGPVRSFSRIKRKLVEASRVEDWTFHDFRRALSTHLNDAGVEPRVVERILGHAVPGIEGVYNRARLEERVRRALTLWERMLLSDGGSSPGPSEF